MGRLQPVDDDRGQLAALVTPGRLRNAAKRLDAAISAPKQRGREKLVELVAREVGLLMSTHSTFALPIESAACTASSAGASLNQGESTPRTIFQAAPHVAGR